MTCLASEHTKRAWDFLDSCSRPLDRAFARHVILDGPAQAVWEALEQYQTPDGGFAHGIEPDLRTPAPQGISTSVALNYLRQSGAPSSLPMVRRAMAYLVDTLDPQRLVWPAIDDRVEMAPHAPWWDSSDLSGYSGFAFNPTADIAAMCYDHSDLVPDSLLNDLTHRMVERLHTFTPLPSTFDLLTCIRLHNSTGVPNSLKSVLADRIPSEIAHLDPADPHADLFALCPTPNTPGATQLADRFPAMVTHLSDTQAPDGSWRPFWNWAFVSEPDWAAAEAEWAAVLTASRLIGLHHHGML